MKFWKLSASVIVVMASSSVNAALVERLGGLAYYDTEANLTWLANANMGIGSGYDTYGDGRMTWSNANAWTAQLSVGGVGGWRLANTVDVGNDGATYTNIYQGVDYGVNITAASELSNMFYNVLGNISSVDSSGNQIVSGWGLQNKGPFSNLQSMGNYWSATEYVSSIDSAWFFNMYYGGQAYRLKTDNLYAWAVQSGDIGAVPVPAAVWLFASGLIGLMGFVRGEKVE